MEQALNTSVWVTSPEFAGYLLKRGFHWRKLWKKRWVALHGVEIVYMEAEPTIENTASMAITKASIISDTVIDREDLDGNQFGFAIHINDGKTPTWYLRAESLREKKSWLMRLAHVHAIVKWLDDYEKVRVLGVGGTGIVYELLHKQNGNRYAMKEMEIKSKSQMKMAIQEAEMLKDIMENISHPNVMHIEKVFQVGSKFYLVFPLCTGGELYEHVIRRGHFTEEDAATLTRDLISGLHALHERDILHLDIKPENILFESMEENARIKITDFGLSRVFSANSDGENSQNAIPTMDELNEKLKQFSEAGVLNRDRLRGTIGYMSPELILTGNSSKATDIFAAGVVLFILLCGHPPFQSKSNREVLERTARGQYSMYGPNWEGISEDAKDLVKKMLLVDPHQRITTTEILQHPWLNPKTSSTQTAVDNAMTDLTLAQTISQPRTTSINLTNTLRQLTAHVNDRKTEKLAMTFTRLVSALGNGQTGSSVLMPLIHKADGTAIDTTSAEDMSLVFMDPDVRDALASAFNNFGIAPGKLSMDQFMSVIRYLNNANANPSTGSTPTSTPAAALGVPAMILCAFIDRDQDGLISIEDLFTTQALVLQKSAVFVKVIFRLYSEAVWYPGRQINFINLQMNKTVPNAKGGGAKVLDDSGRKNVVEPPKFITAKNVATIFEKLGYDPACGTRIFNILCDALIKQKGRVSLGDEGNTHSRHSFHAKNDPTDTDETGSTATMKQDPISPSNGGVTGGSKHRYSEISGSITSLLADDTDPLAGVSTRMSRVSIDKESPLSTGGSPEKESITASSSSAANSANHKMDVNDFIAAVEMDDVLIQAILRKTRLGLHDLIKKAEMIKRDVASKELLEGRDSTTISSPNQKLRAGSVTSAHRSHPQEVFFNLLEQEFSEALRLASEEPSAKSTFPIANLVTNAVSNVFSNLSGATSKGPTK